MPAVARRRQVQQIQRPKPPWLYATTPDVVGIDPSTVANLALYLKPDGFEAHSNGTAESTWVDSSATGATLSQTTTLRPVWTTGVTPNGKGALLFTPASNQCYPITGTGLGIVNGVPALTVFAVVQDLSPGVLGPRDVLTFSINNGGVSTSTARAVTGANNTAGVYRIGGRRADADAIYQPTLAGAANDGSWHVVCWVLDYSGRNVAVWRDGVKTASVVGTAFASGGSTDATVSAVAALGASAPAAGEFWNGYMRWVAGYQRALTDTEIAGVSLFLGADIGIATGHLPAIASQYSAYF